MDAKPLPPAVAASRPATCTSRPTTPARIAALSFEPPSPQLFSFNSPQGMCPDCDGLGELYSFDPEAAGARPERVVQARLLRADRPVERAGPLAAAHLSGRGRHDGAQARSSEPATLLETPWEELDPELQQSVAVGHRRRAHHVHLASTARPIRSTAASSRGSFPSCSASIAASKSKMQQRQLEKYMSVIGCADVRRRAAERRRPARSRSTTRERQVRRASRAQSLPEVCRPVGHRRRRVLQRARARRHAADDRRRSAQGNSRPARLLAQRGPRLSDARPHRADALRRRDRSAFAWPGRSAAGWSACSTFSTSRRSACIRATTTACWTRSTRLRDLGNTVVVVEHDEDTMRAADHIVDFGPGPGVRGGEVVASGTRARRLPSEQRSLTGQYLSRRAQDRRPGRTPAAGNASGCGSSARRTTTCKNVDVEIPLGAVRLRHRRVAARARARWSTTFWSRPCAAI